MTGEGEQRDRVLDIGGLGVGNDVALCPIANLAAFDALAKARRLRFDR